MSSYAYMWRTQPEDSSKKTLYADFMLKNLIRKHGALLDNYVTWGDGTYLDGEEPGSQFGTNEDLLDSLVGGADLIQCRNIRDMISFLKEIPQHSLCYLTQVSEHLKM